MSTYVVSDIHGHYTEFKKLLDIINFNDSDHLYILGDVVDRGPEPIEALVNIMNTKNITMLMGNHEKMMIDGLNHAYNLPVWYNNGGRITHIAFERLSDIEKTIILDYIENLPYVQRITVGDNNFYLSHAGYIKDTDIENLNVFEKDNILWDRDFSDPNNELTEYVITGHTPTILRTKGESNKIYHENKFYDIDCGCMFFEDRIGRLGCLRLDDFEEFYVVSNNERELPLPK